MIKYPDRAEKGVWAVREGGGGICEWETFRQVFVVRGDASLRAANPGVSGNVGHAETKPMAHRIAKTSARRGQSAGGMQRRNLLRQPLNVK